MDNLIDMAQKIAGKEIEKIYTTELGIVTESFPHSAEDDNNNYQCSVKLKNLKLDDGQDFILKKVPVMTSYMGHTAIPNVDDLVIISFIGGNINAPVITGRLYNDIDRPPLHNESEFEIKHTLKEGGAIKIDKDGKITLTSKNEENILLVEDEKISVSNEKMEMTVDFANEKIVINSNKDIEIKAENGKVSIKSKELDIAAESSLKIESGGGADVKASGAMTLKGSTIDLN